MSLELFDEYEKKEKCGLFGVWGTPDAAAVAVVIEVVAGEVAPGDVVLARIFPPAAHVLERVWRPPGQKTTHFRPSRGCV